MGSEWDRQFSKFKWDVNYTTVTNRAGTPGNSFVACVRSRNYVARKLCNLVYTLRVILF